MLLRRRVLLQRSRRLLQGKTNCGAVRATLRLQFWMMAGSSTINAVFLTQYFPADRNRCARGCAQTLSHNASLTYLGQNGPRADACWAFRFTLRQLRRFA